MNLMLNDILTDLQARCDECQCKALKKQLDSALEKVEELEKRLKPRLQLA
jgi:hypothetical protein